MLGQKHLPAGQASAVKGPKPEMAEAPFRKGRCSFYIDGFNLYHAIDDLMDQRLKWVDLGSLCESFLKPGDQLESIDYFTALNTWDAAKRKRHTAYITALEQTGIRITKGSFDRPRKFCHTRGEYCRNYSEKKTDVAIAVSIIADGKEDAYDKAFLISADSDHVPLARRFKQSLPQKILILITPPKRYQEARELVAEVGQSKVFQLTAGRIRSHPLAPEFRNSKGKLLAARPALYGSRP